MKNFNEIKQLGSILFFRGAAVGFKFLLLILLPKFISPSDYGIFSMIVVTITLLIFGFGIDFYNFSIRKYISKGMEYFYDNFISQFFIYVLAYAVGFILIYYFIPFSWAQQYIVLLILIGISEHINSEIYRLLIAFEKTTFANFIFFVRNASWCIITLGLMYFTKILAIDQILNYWLIANCIAVFIVIIVYYKQLFHLKFKISFSFIRNGLHVSLIFFVGTILLKLMEYSNRYIVELILGIRDAGVFNFYMNFAMIITVYINTIVISIQYPRLIKNKDNLPEFLKTFKIFKNDMRIHIIAIFIISILSSYVLLFYLDNPLFSDNIYLIVPVCLGAVLMNYSLIFHFFIYAVNKDIEILKSLAYPAFFSVLLTFALTYFFKSLIAASLGYLVSALVLYIFRYKYYKKISLKHEAKRF